MERRWPYMGSGIGLRPVHYPHILENLPRADWFEAVSENYMDSGGPPFQKLEKIRAHYPVGLHGVSLSIGSADPLNKNYLANLKELARRIDPFVISDHLCWTGVDGINFHDLLPLPYTEEAVRHVATKVKQVQDFLDRTILLENISSYITFAHSAMDEQDFFKAVVEEADCGILLDVNNVFVNAYNHGFDAEKYISALPAERIGQIHLAGFTDRGDYYFDTHDAPVTNGVWELFEKTVAHTGPITTLIERDEHIPEFPALQEEAVRAKNILEAHAKQHARRTANAR